MGSFVIQSVCLYLNLQQKIPYNLKIVNRDIVFWTVEFLFFKTAAEGAETMTQAVLEDQDKLVPGGFYRDCKLATENGIYDSMSATGKQLWALSEKLTGQTKN